MTAEEFLKSKQYDWVEDINTVECMIEFAKMHCKAQAKAICEKADVNRGFPITINKDSILTAYPESNII